MAKQEVLTRFGFDFDAGRLSAVERGVKRSTKNLTTAAHHVDRFQQKMGGFLQRAKGVIAAYLGFRAIRAITTDYATGADSVAKFSAALSLNTETYQGLQHAVQLGGSDTDNLNKALGQLSKRALEASQGLTTNVRAFREAGIEWESAPGKLKSADQLFLELADGLNNLEDKEKAAGLSMQLLGRTGLKLRNTMQLGSKAIREQIKEAKALGKVLSKEQLKAAENFNDEMLRAKSVLQGVRNQIAARLLPAITRQLKAFQEWARRGDNLKVAMGRLKIAALIAATALSAVVAAKTHKAFVNFFSAIKHGIKALRAMGTAAFWAQMKLLLIPAAIALIYLAIEDLVYFAQGKDSLIGRILGDTKIAKSLRKSLLGIWAAAKAAWKDLKPALLEAWKALKPVLKELWDTIKPLIGPAFKAGIWILVTGFQVLAIWIRMAAAAINTLLAIGRAWSNAWDDSIKTLKSGFQKLKWRIEELAPVAKETAKLIGIDFDKLSKSLKSGWAKTKSFFGGMFDSAIRGGKRLLAIMGLIKGGPITWKARAKALVDAQPGTTSTGSPIVKGLLQPGEPRTIFNTGPTTQPEPLGGGPRGAPWLAVPTTATAHVAPGAIQVNVRAEGDPAAVATKVNAAVKAAINTVFTDASRDLVKPPRGQR